jgi:hypothetical protein
MPELFANASALHVVAQQQSSFRYFPLSIARLSLSLALAPDTFVLPGAGLLLRHKFPARAGSLRPALLSHQFGLPLGAFLDCPFARGSPGVRRHSTLPRRFCGYSTPAITEQFRIEASLPTSPVEAQHYPILCSVTSRTGVRTH